MNFPKVCSCGKKYSEGEWFSLELLGYMELDDDHVADCRNCTCKSTISVEVHVSEIRKNSQTSVIFQ